MLQDKRFKNRELQIMKMLDHTNVTTLLHYFYTEGEKAEETYLNLVMDFVPQTVYSMSRQYAKAKKAFPTLFMKLYTYQLCRSLAYIHSLGVCHRDIKPQNLLVHPETHMLKLCDFGSAKILVKGEPNVSYICSRYYRAPELIFGATDYTCCIDVWSAGCVLAELLLGVRELGRVAQERVGPPHAVGLRRPGYYVSAKVARGEGWWLFLEESLSKVFPHRCWP